MPEVMMKAVTSLHKKAANMIKVVPDYSDELPVNVSVHQASVLSPFLLASAIDKVIEVREDYYKKIFMQTTWFL